MAASPRAGLHWESAISLYQHSLQTCSCTLPHSARLLHHSSRPVGTSKPQVPLPSAPTVKYPLPFHAPVPTETTQSARPKPASLPGLFLPIETTRAAIHALSDTSSPDAPYGHRGPCPVGSCEYSFHWQKGVCHAGPHCACTKNKKLH